MAGQVTLIDAEFKYAAGKSRDTQRGSHIYIVCTLPLWHLFTTSGATQVTRHKPRSRKDRPSNLLSMVELTPLTSDAPPPAPAGPAPKEPGREWSDEEKKVIANQVYSGAKLMW